MNCRIRLSLIYIIAFLISISFKLCPAQEKPTDGLYLIPTFGYASYINIAEAPAPAADILGNYAKYRFTLSYMIGGLFGFDVGRHAAIFVNFATIRCKTEYWAKISPIWRGSKNEFGDVYYASLFVRYRIKIWDKSSIYFLIGPTAFTDRTVQSSTHLFNPGILLGFGYGKKVFNFLSINIECNFLGFSKRPSSINVQLRPEFRFQ